MPVMTLNLAFALCIATRGVAVRIWAPTRALLLVSISETKREAFTGRQHPQVKPVECVEHARFCRVKLCRFNLRPANLVFNRLQVTPIPDPHPSRACGSTSALRSRPRARLRGQYKCRSSTLPLVRVSASLAPLSKILRGSSYRLVLYLPRKVGLVCSWLLLPFLGFAFAFVREQCAVSAFYEFHPFSFRKHDPDADVDLCLVRLVGVGGVILASKPLTALHP